MATKDLGTNKLGTREVTPLHQQTISDQFYREGWMRRMVNDEPGRIDRFKLAGWDMVEGQKGKEKIDSFVQGTFTVGSPVCFHNKNQNPHATSHRCYLMEIPLEYYQEMVEQKNTKHRETVQNVHKYAITDGSIDLAKLVAKKGF